MRQGFAKGPFGKGEGGFIFITEGNFGVEGFKESKYGGGIPPVMKKGQFFSLITL
jgi:hypothetical protein